MDAVSSLTLSDFDYALPKELIAAFPPADRPSAKLLRVDRKTGALEHFIFREIAGLLSPGDVLVLNNTRVFPARLWGRKPTGGKVEALLLKRTGPDCWDALLRPGGRIRKGSRIAFGENGVCLEAEVLDDLRVDSGERAIRFKGPDSDRMIEKIGHMPLPPYLDRADTELDRESYQTVFAEKDGAVAAPTAGLHFDRPLLEACRAGGIEIVFVTLHTGYGTFQPVTEEIFQKHRMHPEDFEISEDCAASVNRALRDGRRVIACGTTSVRALESAVGTDGFVKPVSGQTRLFIYPPHEFKVVRGLITNFHLPKSSLLFLAAAFMGSHEKLLAAYGEAIRLGYRFYSYGDAMVIL